MSDPKHELQTAFHTYVKARQTVTIFPAKVTGINEPTFSCNVEDSDGNEIYEVRLRATIDGSDDGFMLIPEVGSWILIGNIGNSPGEYAMVASSAISQAALKIGQSAWLVDQDTVTAQKGLTAVKVEADGVSIERNSVSLKTVLDAIIEQIKLITVTCAAPGAPSTPPLNLAAFEALKVQLDSILK